MQIHFTSKVSWTFVESPNLNFTILKPSVIVSWELAGNACIFSTCLTYCVNQNASILTSRSGLVLHQFQSCQITLHFLFLCTIFEGDGNVAVWPRR